MSEDGRDHEEAGAGAMGYQQTLMYGRYSRSLGDELREEMRRQKMLEKTAQGEEGDPQATAAGLKMSLWETRKLNEHHQSLLKEQLWQQKHLET